MLEVVGSDLRFSSQCGQNHSPFGAASKGGVRQKVWYALLHASPSHSSIRIAPSRRPHFLHAASSSSLLASGPSSAAAAAATCCCGGSGFRAGAGAEAAAAGCAAGAVAFARGSLGLAVDLGGDAFVDFLFFFADGPAQSPGGLFACATSSPRSISATTEKPVASMSSCVRNATLPVGRGRMPDSRTR